MIRPTVSILLGALLVTGCIFPSFDDMQNGKRAKGDDTEVTDANPDDSNPIDVKNADVTADAAPNAALDGAVVGTSPNGSADAGQDVATAPPPGAGKVTCGTSECAVSSASKVYCCAGYASPQFSCRNDDSFDAVLGCSNGIAHALFCDEKADCPAGQFCCHGDEGSGGVARCAASCGGIVMCKADSDCPNNRKCNGGPLANDVPNTVCGT